MPLFDGAIPLDGKNLQASRRKYAPEITAYILFGFLDIVLSRPSDTAFVVVKLNVCIQVTCMLFKLVGRASVIECVKEISIEF